MKEASETVPGIFIQLCTHDTDQHYEVRMEPIINHIQITVKDLNAAETFYDRFLPLLGFDPQKKVSAVIEDQP